MIFFSLFLPHRGHGIASSNFPACTTYFSMCETDATRAAEGGAADLLQEWSTVDAIVRGSRGRGLWDGPSPARELSGQDVIRLTLDAMQRNAVPVAHSGTALLLRFAVTDFSLAGCYPPSRVLLLIHP
mgnify:CR=1 FL=1|jgi:hypothetical protein